MKPFITIGLGILALFLLFGCTQPAPSSNLFEKLSNNMCTENGKPLIRYYCTSWCPHCRYINPIFDSVMAEYNNQIMVRHYVVDLNTPPVEDMNEFLKFSPNGNVPAFSFGCEYYRIGNSFESQGDLNAEKTEFERVINLLLEQSSQ
jgi:thiol-disulfide isomerase/thioredoxin